MKLARTFTVAALLAASTGFGTAAVAQDYPNRDRSSQDQQMPRGQQGDPRQGQYGQGRGAGDGDSRYQGDRTDQRGGYDQRRDGRSGDSRDHGDGRDQGRGYDDHSRGYDDHDRADQRGYHGGQRYGGNNGYHYGHHARCVTQLRHHHRITRCY